MKIMFWCSVLIISFLTSANSQRHLNIREKLEHLLTDPEYNDAANEIHKPRQIHGMLLKDLSENQNIFDTSSEERFFEKLTKSLEKLSAIAEDSVEQSEEETTQPAITKPTTIATSTVTSDRADEEMTTNTMLEQRPSTPGGRLGSIISRLISIWRN